MMDLNQGLDLSQMLPFDSIGARVETSPKLTRMEVPGPDGQPAQMMVPVLDIRVTRVNGTTVTVALPPDMIVPVAHSLLGFLTKLGATPPAPPTTPGPDSGPLSTGKDN